MVGDKDVVILVGEIGDLEKFGYYCFDLKGEKQILVNDVEKSRGGPAYRLISVEGFVRGKIDGEEAEVKIPKNIKNFLTYENNKCYIAAPRSLSGFKDYYHNRTLSLSIEDWDYYPINYSEIPRFIDDAILFENMKDEEETNG